MEFKCTSKCIHKKIKWEDSKIEEHNGIKRIANAMELYCNINKDVTKTNCEYEE